MAQTRQPPASNADEHAAASSTRSAAADPLDDDDPRRWYSPNLIGVSATDLSSTLFNASPVRLFIAGTRETHRGLFALLEQCASLEETAEAFAHYMAVAFSLYRDERDASSPEKNGRRASYLKLLQGWGFDSNGAQGAVLKAWVESRFGITPTFHGAPLDAFPSPAWTQYLEEKLSSRFHNNCIHLQLDVLYEYCQWSIERFQPIGPQHLLLYRGTSSHEAPFIAGSRKTRRGVVRMNNLVSFSLSPERAEEFGDWVLQARVPCAKVLFYPGLLRNQVLNGEGEALVIGGDFEVTVSGV